MLISILKNMLIKEIKEKEKEEKGKNPKRNK
jgi:hypothetical protein